MAALQHVDEPAYSALIFRRTYADLALPGAIMDRAHDWLGGSGARWNGQEKTWTFPSGATLTFGYLDTENDKYRYQGAEVQFLAFDELTQFRESQYLYLFSRLRRLAGSAVPLRMRAASNPGGVGHDWVKQRFIAPHEEPDRVFVPARLADNPYLDQDAYTSSLEQLDAVTRAQLLEGDWDVLPSGDLFRRENFGLMKGLPIHGRLVRYWDKAGTEDGGDRTAGVLMLRTNEGRFIVADAVFGRWSALERERVIEQTTHMDANQYGGRYAVWVEQEGGSGGKESAESTVRRLAGFDVHAERVTGSKLVRAQPLAAQVEAGNVSLIEGSWNREYVDELVSFPSGVHDDLVDASSGAFAKLTGKEKAVASGLQYA